MTPNNTSKKIFQYFIDKTGFERDTLRNVFYEKGRTYAFATVNNNNFQVRQLYQDCEGAYVFHAPSNTLYRFQKYKMKIGGATRIAPDGTKAFNAKMDKNKGIKVGKLY